MQDNRANLFTRDDVILGVCEAVGEDLGFNPIWLRIAFAATLLWNPVAVISAYLGLGVFVLGSRLIAPRPKAKPGKAQSAEPRQASESQDSFAEAA
jgi:phage shock protein C